MISKFLSILRPKKISSDCYITSQPQLDSLINEIREVKILAIDTEFTRQTTYYPILSIIQVAIKNPHKKRFIIDCLSGLDLTEFFAIISDAKIKKILHSSLQDLQIFQQGSGHLPKSIIDTQIMANFCGFGCNVGYSNLVEKIFSKKLNKDQQRSDWQRRPLSKKQIDYAVLDVEFLHEIYEKFSKILEKKKRVKWFLEEMDIFMSKAFTKSEEGLLKNFTFKNKSDLQISQIRKLVLWREKLAQKHDVIRQYFLRDEEIEKVVEDASITKNYHRKLTAEMLLEIEEILQEKEEPFKKRPNLFMNEKQKKSLQKAKDKITQISAKEKFSSQFLITAIDLKKVVCDKNILDKAVSGWRYDLFGKELKEIIAD